MINLHNHSYYSYKRTYQTIDDIMNRAEEMGDNTFAITDTDSVTVFAKGLMASLGRDMKMIAGVELFMKPDLKYDAGYISERITKLKGIMNRKTIDQKMKDLLQTFGISAFQSEDGTIKEVEIGRTPIELYYAMENKLDSLRDRLNNKIRTESGQLKPSKIPFTTENFRLLFYAKNQVGLSNLMKMFSYQEKVMDEDGNDVLETTMPKFEDLEHMPILVKDGTRLNHRNVEVDVFKEIEVGDSIFECVDVLTGFDGSKVSWLIEHDEYDKAKTEVLKMMKKSNVFLTLEGYGSGTYERDHKVNTALIKLNKELRQYKNRIDEGIYYHDLNIIAANDVYYGNEEDEVETQLFQAVFENKTSETFNKKNQYMMNEEQMKQCLLETGIGEEDVNTAIENIQKFANTIDFVNFPSGDPLRDYNQELRDACEAQLEKKYPSTDTLGNTITVDMARDRMNTELATIKDMGFSEYFIRVKQITDTMVDIQALLGTARGSGAGSIVNYLTGITGVDPLQYNLFFERFLNAGRKAFNKKVKTIPELRDDKLMKKMYESNRLIQEDKTGNGKFVEWNDLKLYGYIDAAGREVFIGEEQRNWPSLLTMKGASKALSSSVEKVDGGILNDGKDKNEIKFYNQPSVAYSFPDIDLDLQSYYF